MLPDAGSPSDGVIRAVATHLETGPLALPPLYDSVDPELLDACIDRTDGVSVSFRFAEVPVTVDGAGRVQIEESAAAVPGESAAEGTEAAD